MYAFKQNPKQALETAIKKEFGREVKPVVEAQRLKRTGDNGKVYDDDYVVTVVLPNGLELAHRCRDWRKAYVELAKLIPGTREIVLDAVTGQVQNKAIEG